MADHFEIFGIDRKFSVDNDALERRFHELQSASHPDRHVNSTDTARTQSLADSSDINSAYRTLREPMSRLKYLLSLYDFSVGDQKRVPSALLMTVMEAQEKIGELDAAKDNAAKERIGKELFSVAEHLEARRVVLDDERHGIERQWDAAKHGSSISDLNDHDRSMLQRLTEIMAERAYIETLHISVQAARHGKPAIIKH